MRGSGTRPCGLDEAFDVLADGVGGAVTARVTGHLVAPIIHQETVERVGDLAVVFGGRAHPPCPGHRVDLLGVAREKGPVRQVHALGLRVGGQGRPIVHLGLQGDGKELAARAARFRKPPLHGHQVMGLGRARSGAARIDEIHEDDLAPQVGQLHGLARLGLDELSETIQELLEDHPADTHLKLDLDGRDPDDGMTDVAYEKGYFFLRMLEDAFGRERWDIFLRSYFDRFSFQPMPTEGFLAFLDKGLLAGDRTLAKKLRIDEWVYGPGLPANLPLVRSEALKNCLLYTSPSPRD